MGRDPARTPREVPPAETKAFDTATADPLEPMTIEAQRVNVWSWADALTKVCDGKPLDVLERASLAVLLGRLTDALGAPYPFEGALAALRVPE